MRRTTAAAFATLALAACQDTPQLIAPDGAANQAASSNAPIYLVTFKPGVDVASTARDMGLAHGFSIRFLRSHAAPGFSAVIPESRISAIRNDSRVLIVERDGPVSLIRPIETAARPGGGGSGGQVTPWGITRVGGAGSGVGRTAWVI